jgi:23S rRNA pseudouridine1911/1915/1917 synthase
VRSAEGNDGAITRTIRVEQPAGDRLDRYLAEKLDLSRSHAAALIESGYVRVAGQTPKKSYVPQPGDLIVVEVPAAGPSTASPEDIAIEIIYEDEGLVVVNKPAGMVVHPAPGHPRGTLVNALLHHSGRLSTLGGATRPGVVHRLDKDTSGLMIMAKDETVHRRLADALARRRVVRRYLAACWGHLRDDHLTIEAELGRHRGDRKRMAVVAGARPALTEVDRLERWRAADLLSVRLHTGRTHQIRVHLHYIGHPVVGDRQYGAGWERGLAGSAGRWPLELARRVPRQFLHAAELAFEHPLTGRRVEFAVGLPADLAGAAEWARQTS